ncbi:Cyclin-T1-4 isoform A [Glycine soja]|uniref:B-like cyclin n=1 Tax=Glycine soja TaxID=3848 RepID=A0A445HUZ8_GLYSO|nr:Cyclin-T1-4 isoform A [Glycine soja]
MSFGWNLQAPGHDLHGVYWSTCDGNNFNNGNRKRSRISYYHGNSNIHNNYWAEHGVYSNVYHFDYGNHFQCDADPLSLKRRKHSSPICENNQKYYLPSTVQGNIPSSVNFQASPTRSNVDTSVSPICKLDCSIFEDKELVFMSRDEIDRCSPSRKDGIDVLRERHLRYSYCAFLQNLGMWLNLPQTTIGTAMVLCHRFFVRRSHACHDRFLIATAALFLVGKSEETPCPLNNVLQASSEILHEQDFTLLSYLLPVGWFEKYHDRVLEAELLLLTTLNFELNVEHPYTSLTSVLNKLDPSKTVLVNLALNLISKGLQSSLWLQYKPHHIAAGAAYLASMFLKIDLTAYHNIWQEFEATPSILRGTLHPLLPSFPFSPFPC